MTATQPTTTDIDWLLNDMVDRVPDVDSVVALSADGLAKGNSSTLSTSDAEHLAAAASAFQSLANGTGRHFGGGEVRQTVVEMQQRFLLVTAVGVSGCLAVFTTVQADLGMVAYETNMLVTKVGTTLAPAARRAQDTVPSKTA